MSPSHNGLLDVLHLQFIPNIFPLMLAWVYSVQGIFTQFSIAKVIEEMELLAFFEASAEVETTYPYLPRSYFEDSKFRRL